MIQKEINTLIDACIFFSEDKKIFLKKNFVVYPKEKQERILLMLQKVSKLSATGEDFEVFRYGMKMWQNKKKLEILEKENR